MKKSRWAALSVTLLAAPVVVLSTNVSADDPNTPEELALIEYQEKFLDEQSPEFGTRPGGHEAAHAEHQRASKDAERISTAARFTPDVGGQWTYAGPFDVSFNTVHTITGPNDKVLLIAGSGNSESNFNAGSFRTFLWNTKTNARRAIHTPTDLFCAGHMLLPDGCALIAGGNLAYEPFKGIKDLYAFDFTQERYEKLTDMQVGRWYPSVVADKSGNALIHGGLGVDGRNETLPEYYNWRTGSLTALPGHREFPLHPRLHYAENGRFFHAGGEGWSPPGFWNPFVVNSFAPVNGHRLFAVNRSGGPSEAHWLTLR